MTKSPRKNVPDVGIELGAACMPSELASDRATAPGYVILDETANHMDPVYQIHDKINLNYIVLALEVIILWYESATSIWSNGT